MAKMTSSDNTGNILTIFLSSSSGAFTRVNTSQAGFSSIFLSVGDFNGDGFKDILSGFSNGYTVYFGSATGAFTQTTVDRKFYNGYPNADFDGDGKDDFIATAPNYYFSATSLLYSNSKTKIVAFRSPAIATPDCSKRKNLKNIIPSIAEVRVILRA